MKSEGISLKEYTIPRLEDDEYVFLYVDKNGSKVSVAIYDQKFQSRIKTFQKGYYKITRRGISLKVGGYQTLEELLMWHASDNEEYEIAAKIRDIKNQQEQSPKISMPKNLVKEKNKKRKEII